MTSIIILGFLTVFIFVAHWRKNKVIMITISILILGMLVFQQLGFEPYFRFLLGQRDGNPVEVKSYLEGAVDFMNYACKLRWFVFAEAFLLFLVAALCLGRTKER